MCLFKIWKWYLFKRWIEMIINSNETRWSNLSGLLYGWLLSIKIFIRIHMENYIIYDAQLVYSRWQQRQQWYEWKDMHSLFNWILPLILNIITKRENWDEIWAYSAVVHHHHRSSFAYNFMRIYQSMPFSAISGKYIILKMLSWHQDISTVYKTGTGCNNIMTMKLHIIVANAYTKE